MTQLDSVCLIITVDHADRFSTSNCLGTLPRKLVEAAAKG